MLRRALSSCTVGVVAASLGFSSPCRADEILKIDSSSLTAYLYNTGAGLTAVQGARPLPEQRLVNLDGTDRRLRTAAPWSFAGNPFESAQPGEAQGPIRTSTGNFTVNDVDLSLPATVPWVIGRTYNSVQLSNAGPPAIFDEQGPQGTNWWQMSQMELRLYWNGSDKSVNDVLYLVARNDGYVEFARTGDDEDTFKAVNGATGVFKYVSGSPDTFVYYGPYGQISFFGGNTASHAADWQVWKIANQNGDTAYVGDASTAATAVTNGFNSDGTIKYAFDSADRRYHYCYATPSGDSYSRLVDVKAETKTGGTWFSSPTGVALVGEVAYTYYDSGDHYWGDVGNLKLVTVTAPLSNYALDSSEVLTQRRYYRYITESTNENALVLAVGFDGIRQKTGGDYTSTSFNTHPTPTTSDLVPYADAYMTYGSGRMVASARFDGECGCGGGSIDGLYTFTYLTNGGLCPDWDHRVTIQPPTGGAWRVIYYDNVGQAGSRVLTDIDPSAAGPPAPQHWITKIVRDGDGRVTEVHTPANVTNYYNDTGGPQPQGTIVTSSSVGLVYLYDRVGSGAGGPPELGFLHAVRQYKGDSSLSTNAEYLSRTTYTSPTEACDLTTASVYRPTIYQVRLYNVAGTNDSINYDSEYTYTYDWWSATSTNPLVIALKSATTTNPTVTTGNNGSNSATSTVRYVRKDGTTAFTVSARGSTTYTLYTQGLLTTRIEDCKTNSGSDFAGGDDPNGDFGITETGNGFDRMTQWSYDAQGRVDQTVLPTRTMKKWYTHLGDDRLVTFSVPRVAFPPAADPIYYGPVQYTVDNQAGDTEDCMIVAVDAGGTSDDPSGWLTVSAPSPIPHASDPLVALNTAHLGLIERFRESLYNETGRKLATRRVYSVIPASLVSVPTADYDEWNVRYDDMGRQVQTTDPTATINRTSFDVLSRVTARSIGTNGPLEMGTDDMVTTEADVYDGGSDGGNSDITQRTLYVVDGATNDRVTTYAYDYRSRLITTLGPLPPYQVIGYDNRSRVTGVATYTSTSGLSASSVPTTTTNRCDYTTKDYDERGSVWRTTRYAINQSTGAFSSPADTLDTLYWRDADGVIIVTQGEQLVKVRRDSLGRTIQQATLATLGSTTYSTLYDSTNQWASFSGDKVLEEVQTDYDTATNEVKMRAVISRDYGDTSTTGPLDTTYDGGDGDPDTFTAADIAGRMQAWVYYYDELERPVQTEFYGTNASTANVATLAYPGSPLSSSSGSVLVTQTAYNDDGSVQQSKDANGTATKYLYDQAGRLVATIGNYQGGSLSSALRDHDLYTRYAYEKGLQRFLWVDIKGDDTDGLAPVGGHADGNDTDDQVTEYVYIVPKGSAGGGSGLDNIQSEIAANNLLHHVIYPIGTYSSADDRKVVYAYNAQRQLEYTRDQEGNIITVTYDTLGRESGRGITATGAFDSRVASTLTTYQDRGQLRRIKQLDGSGNIIGAVQYAYDTWGNLTTFTQNLTNDIGSGSMQSAVTYLYDKATGGRHTLRRNSVVLPGAGGETLYYDYSSSSGKLDDAASRVTSIHIGSIFPTYWAKYEYLGAAQLAGTDLPLSQARSNLFEGASGGTPYPQLDPFNRVKVSRWVSYKNSTNKDFYKVDLSYDYASNITSTTDDVMTDGSNNTSDVKYTLDGLYRVARAQEGNLSGGSISPAFRDERWTDSGGSPGLTQTGVWKYHILDGNGDTTLTDPGDINETTTSNTANELLTRDLDSNTVVDLTLNYDKCGNQISDGAQTYVYDPMGHLVEIHDAGTGHLIAQYQYNALGYMTQRLVDTNVDGTVDGSDTPEWNFYDERSRRVVTDLGDTSDMLQRCWYNTAGFGGYGGSSYIDDRLMLEYDSDGDGAADALGFYAHNWHHDVVSMLDDGGNWIENNRYSAYGRPREALADIDGDGVPGDVGPILTWISGSVYHTDGDLDLDGDVDSTDNALAYYLTGIPIGNLSRSDVGNRSGYAGYEYEPVLEGAGKHLYFVRNRALDSDTGRWTRRDPFGYVGGLNLYCYCFEMPLNAVDPLGLAANSDTPWPPLNPPGPPYILPTQGPGPNPFGPPPYAPGTVVPAVPPGTPASLVPGMMPPSQPHSLCEDTAATAACVAGCPAAIAAAIATAYTNCSSTVTLAHTGCYMSCPAPGSWGSSACRFACDRVADIASGYCSAARAAQRLSEMSGMSELACEGSCHSKYQYIAFGAPCPPGWTTVVPYVGPIPPSFMTPNAPPPGAPATPPPPAVPKGSNEGGPGPCPSPSGPATISVPPVQTGNRCQDYVGLTCNDTYMPQGP